MIDAAVKEARQEDALEFNKDRLEYRSVIERLVVLAVKQGLSADESAELSKIKENNEWDGLGCSCGGGWLVGHLAGCPDDSAKIGGAS